MRQLVFFSTLIVAVCSTQSVWAQHSDVEFGYDDTAAPTAIIIENDNVTSEGIQVFESGFEELDPFNAGDFSADEPGFTTEAAEGLLFNEGDQIFINALDASAHSIFGVGYVNFYNPNTGMLEAANRVSIVDNTAGTTDRILDGTMASGDTLQFLGSVDSDGDLHDHVVFDLLDDDTAPAGAYGILVDIQADFADADGTTDLVSDPVWFIFNHQLSEEDFENLALPSFGLSAVPEPGSFAVLFAGAACLLTRRRR